MTEKAQQFAAEMKALVLKYRPEVCIDPGYYGEVYGVEFVVDGAICVTMGLYTDPDNWDFGDGLKPLDDLS